MQNTLIRMSSMEEVEQWRRSIHAAPDTRRRNRGGHRQPFGLRGHMDAVLKKGNGEIFVLHKPNLIVDDGVDLIADALGKPSSRPNVISHIAIGTDNTAAATTDTALNTELARAAATYAHTAGTATFTMAATFAAGTGTGALVEAGVLNAASTGTLLNRVVFSVINKGASDSLTQTFTFTIS